MSLWEKIYSRIKFVNNSAPPINATNLNKMDSAIDTLDDRIIELDNDKLSKKGGTVEGVLKMYTDDETLNIAGNGIRGNGNNYLTKFESVSAATLEYGDEDTDKRYVKNEDFEKKIENSTKISSLSATSQIIPTASGSLITVKDSSDNAPVSISLYGKCEQGENPTPEAPQEVTVAGADGDIVVTSCGKNLLNNTVETSSSHGITFTKNEDGSVSYSGVSSDGAGAWYYGMGGSGITYDSGVLFKAGTYIYSVENSAINVLVRIINEDNTYQNIALGSQSCLFTLEEDCRIWAACALSGVAQGQSYSGTFYPMIRIASITDDTYKPYTATTTTVPTPNGLLGIPVSSGGNYIDENGQQWVCDTIEYEEDGSGFYEQRVGKIVLDASSDESWTVVNQSGNLYIANIKVNDFKWVSDSTINYMCSHFGAISVNERYKDGTLIVNNASALMFTGSFFTTLAEWKAWLASNPITVYYELAEPIETPLTSKQITELEKLKTFKPVTNVFTDDIADVGIEYVADIKLYIDNKFNELETAILSAVGSEV